MTSGEFKMVPVAEPYDGSQAPMMGAGYDAALAAAPAHAEAVPPDLLSEIVEVLGTYVIMGPGKCTIGRPHVDRAVAVLERAMAVKASPPPTDAEAVRRAALEEVVAWHKDEIARLERQIEENNEYRRRIGRNYTIASEANEACLSGIRHHRMSIDAIMAFSSQPPATGCRWAAISEKEEGSALLRPQPPTGGEDA
ncbi:enterotoxin A family protein [Ancylobacter oerskovii]|uniref:Enterotoxin A family protein n=1 Tax=Ancylobacter oerskovii TaxID=459519 RepID=A0ABW4Z2A0_9HYPH|nr:enterotoxin A family protein [Ancylobacter oerskovii]MBS7545069.1 hypothetical protein [Ancylobacter oerskovii]